MTGSDAPPRWAERLLRLSLRRRDRDTVTGDLLEEYREAILPTRGRLRAQLWYLRHAISLVPGVVLGVVIGMVFGTWNLLFTWLDPLADDTPLALLTHYGPIFTAWGIASFAATRRRGRFIDAVKTGAMLGLVTLVVLSFANLVRVNLFLDTIQHRADWRNMMVRFHNSDFESLRAFVNYDYATGFWLKVVVGMAIGATIGAIAGLAASLVRRKAPDDSMHVEAVVRPDQDRAPGPGIPSPGYTPRVVAVAFRPAPGSRRGCDEAARLPSAWRSPAGSARGADRDRR